MFLWSRQEDIEVWPAKYSRTSTDGRKITNVNIHKKSQKSIF